FKGAYRPYLNSKLMESIPIKSLRASFLSLSAFIGAIVAFFIQFTSGQIFKNIFEKNLLISILSLLFCTLIIFFLSKSKNNSKIHLKNYNGFSSKENYIDIYNDSIVFIQKYFECLSEDFKKGLNGIYSNIYPAPKIYKITNNEIYFEYTVGKISSNLNKNKQEIILSKILNNIKNNIKTISISNTNLYSETLSNTDIFIENKDLYSKLCNTKYLSLIHGDLHLDNIIVTSDNYYVVDWDLFGIGYIWFDVLTLLTSPNLKLNKNQRIYNFIQIFPEFNESEVKLIFNIFIKQKINVFSKLKSSLFGYKMYTKFITLDKTFSRERGELSYE
ncbi:MAG: aminoglycoside phosphotransferase family protein, partial [Cetobacterium somerae]